MKVLHIISRMNAGGTATYLSNLILGLEKLGYENLLVHGNPHEGEVEATSVIDLPSVRIPELRRELSINGDIEAREKFARILSRYSPNFVHSHAFKAGLIARSVSQRNTKFIHTFHGHHLYDPEFGKLARYAMKISERTLNSRTHAYVTVGKRVGKELHSAHYFTRDFVSIPPGVNSISKLSREEARKRIGIPTNARVIGWLGRFIEVKRPRVLLQLAKTFPDVVFVMGGDGPMFEDMKVSAPSNLQMLGWIDSDLVLSASDLFLSTSRSEGMPLALIEAQQYGLPVIAPDVGSISEIILNGRTGFCISEDLQELSNCLFKLLNNDLLRKQFSEDAAKFAREEFSREKMANRHHQLYSQVQE